MFESGNNVNRFGRMRPGYPLSEALRADRFNQPLDELVIIKDHIARNISPDKDTIITAEHFLGQIVTKATASEYITPTEVFTDNRYYVRRCVPKATLKQDATLLIEEDKLHESRNRVVVATNLAEAEGESHNLSQGGDLIVHVWGLTVSRPRTVTLGIASSPPAGTIDLHRVYYFSHGGAGSEILVKLTSAYSSGYAWEEYEMDDAGTPIVVTGGRTSTTTGIKAREVNGNQALDSGMYVWLHIGTDSSSSAAVYQFSVPTGILFPVNLTQTGGSNGTSTTAATYTYTATSISGVQLGTGLSPTVPRFMVGTMTAATKGMGYYNTSGVFVLYQAFEVKSTTNPC